MKLQVYYINLASATERRQSFEEEFQKAQFSSEVVLNRLEAINKYDPRIPGIAGPIDDRMKAAHLSHVECVKRSLDHDSHVLVAEDDTVFHRATESCLGHVIDHLGEDSWDIIYTDVMISRSMDMLSLFQYRKEFSRTGKLQIVSTSVFPSPFAGAGSYVVNRKSRQKFLAELDTNNMWAAYDLMLREKCRSSALNGVLVFPFLTTVSEHGDLSQNQDGYTSAVMNKIWNAYRRLVWIGSNSDDDILRNTVDALRAVPVDADAETFCTIIRPLLSCEITGNWVLNAPAS